MMQEIGKEDETPSDGKTEEFQQCSQAHPENVRISQVDVVENFIGLRCRLCRRIYHLDVELIETHQS